ncbi:MAG: bifunctional phosphopantothenoylcysteine decarboxylase/phosphopantothenate synthase [Gemmataceae bacterium]|nr:bifunctional phosphopantothenoylcysteine decarboxylase/phosphopantothenate synthase [Gemmataceae bacterium]
MNVLVTAGNTQTPLDQVRCITNIFTGRTGAQVAARAFDAGHRVTLLTSHPEALDGIPPGRPRAEPDWRVRGYRTFDDLESLMAAEITRGGYDLIVHAAAVSDFHVAGVFTHAGGQFTDASAGKVKSSHPELWVKLVQAPKLVDKVRAEWGFGGTLVKFKLEVGVTDAELEAIAERSRVHSRADLMVANTLEGRHEWAIVGAGAGGYARVSRAELAARLLDAVAAVRGG